ncbi:hypothetical protein HK102_000093 [Quaeritorhiza haematococci]|nr:hypothetical protein HK102_000093 [Quaeritorhiza haematococci]
MDAGKGVAVDYKNHGVFAPIFPPITLNLNRSEDSQIPDIPPTVRSSSLSKPIMMKATAALCISLVAAGLTAGVDATPNTKETSTYYGYDYCATSYYPEDSGFGYPYCSHQYTGGYEYNHSDCLEYGYECGKSCVKKGGVKCYGEYDQHQQQSTEYYTPEPVPKQQYAHRPQSAAPRRHLRAAPLRHANTEYHTPEQSYYGGNDYCSSYSASYSEFGFPYCSEHYTGGYEYNHSDCLEYGYECGQSCIKQGGKKCYADTYSHKSESKDYGHTETKKYFHHPAGVRHANNYHEQQTSYYTPQEETYYGGDYCSSYSASYSEFGFPYCSEHYTGGYEYNHSDCLEYGYECGQSCVKQGSKKCYADSYSHKTESKDYGHTESKKYFRPAAVRHANTEQSYYTPEQPKSYYGGHDYCSAYSASYSEFGFPYCSEHYTGGYEYNHSDCLEYGYECGQSCIKKGGKKCEASSYYHEEQQQQHHGGYY